MTDLPKVSPEGAQEPAAAPLPAVTSSASAGEPGSAADVSTRILTTLESLDARLGKLEDRDPADPEQVEKFVQRHVDRRLHPFEGVSPEDITIVAKTLRAAGVSPETVAAALGAQPQVPQASAEAARQPTSDSKSPRASSPEASGKAAEEKLKAKALKQLSKSGLNDEQQAQVFEEWSQQSYEGETDEDGWDNAFAGLTALAIAASKAPVAAGGEVVVEPAEEHTVGVGTALPSGVGRPSASAADKATEVDNLYGQLTGLYKEPSKNKAAILATEARLRELGQDINTTPTF